MTAYRLNVRNNQIGGQTDGVSPEVMADIGYETLERTQEIIRDLGEPGVGANVEVTAIDEPDPAPYTLDARFINNRQYVCAIDSEGNILARLPASEKNNTHQWTQVAQEAEAKLKKSGK